MPGARDALHFKKKKKRERNNAISMPGARDAAQRHGQDPGVRGGAALITVPLSGNNHFRRVRSRCDVVRIFSFFNRIFLF